MSIFHKGTLLLEETDIVHLIKDKISLNGFLSQLIKALEAGFKQFAEGQIVTPPRHEFYFNNGSVESMSASNRDYFSCKIVNTHKENPSKFGIPTIIANGILVDGETGYPLMITGSTILTALRTGVASAIATKYLSRKGNNNTIGIIGNGAQSLPQLHAISLIRDIKKVYIYDLDFNASLSFKNSAEKICKDMEVNIASNSQEVCSKSDILVTATCKDKNTHPIVCDKWIDNGTHINAIGGDAPNKIELEKSLMERSKIVVDFKDQAVYEGEVQQIYDGKIYASLSEIVAGQKSGRINNDEITIFDSVGFAMEDLQVYKLIYELAIKEKVGKRIDITSVPKNSKNIYQSFFNM